MTADIPTDPILTHIPAPIRTPRLVLRPTMPGDGPATHDAVVETYDQLKLWMPWAKTLEAPDITEINIRKAYADFILRKDLRLIGHEIETGKAVTFCGLHRFNWEARSFEIGYWVRASAQGSGYATEVANALTRYAFNALNANRVMIVHASGNDRSRKVIEKLGYEREGIYRNDVVLNDTLKDSHVYSRLNTKDLPPLDVRWGP